MKLLGKHIWLRIIWVAIGLMIALYSIFSPDFVIKKLVAGLKDVKDV